MQSTSYWQLRPRDQVPALVRVSISIEDTHSFLILLASQPLTPFLDCRIQKAIIRDVKEAQRRQKTSQSMHPLSQQQSYILNGLHGNGASSPNGDIEMIGSIPFSPLQTPRTARTASGRRHLEREDPTPIGPNYQADVPKWSGPTVDPKELRNVESTCVFAPDGFPAEDMEKFLKRCNNWLVRRSGYPLSPMAEERALRELARERGNIDVAAKTVLSNIATYGLYSGEGLPWSDAERALFSRTLEEAGCNFEYMSRHGLKHRKTSELVVYYYARYKQVWQHYGEGKLGDMYDCDDQQSYTSDRSVATQIGALQALAASAGDGFPPTHHMRRNMLLFRNARVSTINAKKTLADDRRMWGL